MRLTLTSFSESSSLPGSATTSRLPRRALSCSTTSPLGSCSNGQAGWRDRRMKAQVVFGAVKRLAAAVLHAAGSAFRKCHTRLSRWSRGARPGVASLRGGGKPVWGWRLQVWRSQGRPVPGSFRALLHPVWPIPSGRVRGHLSHIGPARYVITRPRTRGRWQRRHHPGLSHRSGMIAAATVVMMATDPAA